MSIHPLEQWFNSIYDVVEVLDDHVHHGLRWFGLATTPAAETHKADRQGAGAAGAECGPIVVDAGNDDWGTWTQILGSTDTPCDSGTGTHFDLNTIHVTAYEDTATLYMIQIAFQEDAPADDPSASDVYTETQVTSAGVGATARTIPVTVQGNRVVAGTKVWMRTRAPNKSTSTISFYMGLHEY